MANFHIALFIVVLLCRVSAYGQDTLRLELNDCIEIAVENSVDALKAESQFVSAYWEYRNYRAELMPSVNFTGTLPQYSKTFDRYQNSDGSYRYVSSESTLAQASVSLEQTIPWTGGTFAVETQLGRIGSPGYETEYRTVPWSITLSQNLSGYNPVRWQRRIEPIKYRAARKEYTEKIAEIALTTAGYFFDLALESANMEIALQNLENARKIHTIALARREMGTLSENDLIQIEVSMLSAEAYLSETVSSFRTAGFALASYMAMPSGTVIAPVLPDTDPESVPYVQYENVMKLTLENNGAYDRFTQIMTEAAREVAAARSERFGIVLYASIGKSANEKTFRDSYRSSNMIPDRYIEVGVSVPILDWGRSKGKHRVAQANRDVAEAEVEKERMDMELYAYNIVENFNNRRMRLRTAALRDSLASRRYNSSVEAFGLGTIDVLSLSDARNDKDQARRELVTQTGAFWLEYYTIQALTLYDFTAGRPLEISTEKKIPGKRTAHSEKRR